MTLFQYGAHIRRDRIAPQYLAAVVLPLLYQGGEVCGSRRVYAKLVFGTVTIIALSGDSCDELQVPTPAIRVIKGKDGNFLVGLCGEGIKGAEPGGHHQISGVIRPEVSRRGGSAYGKAKRPAVRPWFRGCFLHAQPGFIGADPENGRYFILLGHHGRTLAHSGHLKMPAEEVYPVVENQGFGKRRHLEGVALAIDGYPSDGYSSSVLLHIYSTLCVDILDSRFRPPAGHTTKHGIGAGIRYGIADENFGGDFRSIVTVAGGNHRQCHQRNQQWDYI
ncbi:hypothetical protein ES703_22210 [subsurface metagenome]